jgi:hypothetical protein
MTAPLREPQDIVERQDAVAALGGVGGGMGIMGTDGDGDGGRSDVEEVAGRLRKALRRAPDLERAVVGQCKFRGLDSRVERA